MVKGNATDQVSLLLSEEKRKEAFLYAFDLMAKSLWRDERFGKEQLGSKMILGEVITGLPRLMEVQVVVSVAGRRKVNLTKLLPPPPVPTTRKKLRSRRG